MFHVPCRSRLTLPLWYLLPGTVVRGNTAVTMLQDSCVVYLVRCGNNVKKMWHYYCTGSTTGEGLAFTELAIGGQALQLAGIFGLLVLVSYTWRRGMVCMSYMHVQTDFRRSMIGKRDTG